VSRTCASAALDHKRACAAKFALLWRICGQPKGISADVTQAATSQMVVPTAGAVALPCYKTERNYAVLIQGTREDGTRLSFAAAVFDADDRQVGYVGQGGQALVHVHRPEGSLSIRWGQAADEYCTFDYVVSAKPVAGERFRRIAAVCRQFR